MSVVTVYSAIAEAWSDYNKGDYDRPTTLSEGNPIKEFLHYLNGPMETQKMREIKYGKPPSQKLKEKKQREKREKENTRYNMRMYRDDGSGEPPEPMSDWAKTDFKPDKKFKIGEWNYEIQKTTADKSTPRVETESKVITVKDPEPGSGRKSPEVVVEYKTPPKPESLEFFQIGDNPNATMVQINDSDGEREWQDMLSHLRNNC